MVHHSPIVFRDGPTGLRAGLAGGPDVWEVIVTLQGCGESGEQAILATAAFRSLSAADVWAAVRYYAAHRDEVDEQIQLGRGDGRRYAAGL
ncbi:MAG TPA: hypothetical protein VLA98_03815 [Solirubrobacteraceae bacterium]|nr:hypothetical protein [Solirubrobacteraceae bacterium]HSD79250.1 hypothetical protein [Solirubrobacteraceae bacterium]